MSGTGRQAPYIQRTIPCECGSRDAYWHGPVSRWWKTSEGGVREYSCDACWRKSQAARKRRKGGPSVSEARRTLGGSLHERAAEALGWSMKDVQSVSLQSLRDLVRPVDRRLADDITLVVASGGHITR